MPIGYKKQRLHSQSLFLCRHCAIFPVRRQTSIVATDELNFRVRNGNGWTLVVIDTNFVVANFAGLRFGVVSPLQYEISFHVGLRENEVQDSNSLHTQNRTKGDKRGTLVEPALHRTDEG